MIHSFVINSSKQETFIQEIECISRKINNFLGSHENKIQVVSVTCFIKTDNLQDFIQKRKLLEKLIISSFITSPPIEYVPQSPICGESINFELCYIYNNNDRFTVKSKKHEDINYITISDLETKSKTLWVSGISVFEDYTDIKDAYQIAFEKAQDILKFENMSFGDIYRQWNYIGEITRYQSAYSMHNYQIFNNIRGEFYDRTNFENDYPSATGIGMDIPGVILSFWAAIGKNMEITPIYNNLQVEAYEYSEKQLLVDKEMHLNEKCTPRFTRAKYVHSSIFNDLFLSGTASIRGEVSLHVDDIEKQAKVTIENIQQLLSATKEEIAFFSDKKIKVKHLRVYIKSQEDVNKAVSVVDNYFTDISIVYIIADVCRSELLIEIEGIAGLEVIV